MDFSVTGLSPSLSPESGPTPETEDGRTGRMPASCKDAGGGI